MKYAVIVVSPVFLCSVLSADADCSSLPEEDLLAKSSFSIEIGPSGAYYYDRYYYGNPYYYHGYPYYYGPSYYYYGPGYYRPGGAYFYYRDGGRHHHKHHKHRKH